MDIRHLHAECVKYKYALDEYDMKQTITTPEQLSLILQSAGKRGGLTQSDMASFIDLSQAIAQGHLSQILRPVFPPPSFFAGS